MGKLITFSGGCHSGKTTIIERLAEQNPRLIPVYENIRDHLKDNESIDSARSSPSKYLDLEIRVISKKILTEWSLLFKRGTFLIDRSLADSLFYFEKYIDRRKLSLINKIRYSAFRRVIKVFCRLHFLLVYDEFFVFLPIPAKDLINDQYRPTALDNEMEYFGITKNIREAFRGKFPIFSVKNQDDVEYIRDSVNYLSTL